MACGGTAGADTPDTQSCACAAQVTCDRCGDASTVLTLSSEAISAQQGSSKAGSQVYETSQECGGCHQRLAVALLPRLVHEHSNVWGVLRPQQCTPLDLLPAIVGVQCGDCGSVATMRGVQVRGCPAGLVGARAGVSWGVHGSMCMQLHGVPLLWLLVAMAVGHRGRSWLTSSLVLLQVGAASERNCSHCHRRMLLTIATVAFVPRSDAATGRARRAGPSTRAAGPASAATSKAAAAFNGVLVPGQPLPAFGTCKHYAHSYR
jgi:hypothetical protein